MQETEQGLSQEVARKRLREEGYNRFVGKQRGKLFFRFLAQFKDFMVLTLLAAAGISVGSELLHGGRDFLDSMIIAGIVVVNAIIGVIQEGRAEKALDALQKLANPTALVLRSGIKQRIDAAELVRGDLVFLEAGDVVPADLRLVFGNQITVQESALTGESQHKAKRAGAPDAENTPLPDKQNTLFSSTMVLSGRGRGIVTATGSSTEVGKIASMLREESAPQTPLQIRLEKVGRQLGIGAMAISALVFVLGFLQHIPALESFMLAISLAVAAIPEGLPAMVTVVLSIGVQRMAKSNAIVRRLPAVETLGCASVICSDKTGTLTQNKMTVTKLATHEGIRSLQEPESRRLLRLLALCCNAETQGLGRKQSFTGAPTETAILRAALERRIPVMEDRVRYRRVREVPFDSARKRMSVVVEFPTSSTDAPLQGTALLVKGAPDVLFSRCKFCLAQGKEVPFTASIQQKLQALQNELASVALRVLALAYRPVSRAGAGLDDESQLVFLGMIGMMDPPRREAKAAVKLCKKAGILPLMITGDHVMTAAAIAKELSILEHPEDAACTVTGVELDDMTEQELQERLTHCRVYARVTPEHKMRIVKALRAQGHVVAMTGDGVNDAPALKAADIGCAMGRSGTDVAKGAADMILTDDNFATIVHAIEAGRGIYENIKKAVRFLISSNMGEITAVLIASLMRLPPPLLPIQLLWVNVVTDSAPAIALGVEKTEPGVMLQPPNPVTQNFFTKALGFHMAAEGLLMGIVSLLGFVLGRSVLGHGTEDLLLGRSMAFSILSFVEVLHANHMRSERSLFSIGLFSNPQMTVATILCCGLQAAVVTIPALCRMFGTVPLNGTQWLCVAGLSLVPTFVLELEKLKNKNKNK